MTVTQLSGSAQLARITAPGGLTQPPTADGELRSVSIAVGVLDCFTTAAELGPTQVARRLGIAKSTASRMLSALAAGGMLERTPAGRYRLSIRLFHYGQLAVDRLPLRAVARPVVQELAESLRETVQLGIPAGGHVLYVERAGHPGGRLACDQLRRVPGYSSSAGRIMAAFDEDIAIATLAVERRAHTPFTVTDPPRLRQLIGSARRAGWAAGHEQFRLGYSSIAAPVLVDTPTGPRVAGAVSAVGPTGQILGPRKEFVAAGVCRAARRVSAGLTSRLES